MTKVVLSATRLSAYRVHLEGKEIGTTLLESADPPMGVVGGKIDFQQIVSPFRFLLDYCEAHRILVNLVDSQLESIDTQVIPGLRVFRDDGVEVAGQGCHVSGFKDDGYTVWILGVPYPFYEEEFPYHVTSYSLRYLPK